MTPSRRRGTLAFYITIAPWRLAFCCSPWDRCSISLYISFTCWDLLREPVFLGLDNYLIKMPNDARFWQSLKVTQSYTAAYVPLELIGGLGLALLVRNNIPGVRFFRTVFDPPTMLAGRGLCGCLAADMPTPGADWSTCCWLSLHRNTPWLLDPIWALSAHLNELLGWGLGHGDLSGELKASPAS